MPAGDWQGWTCCVEQGHYGHPARKPTWLYAAGCKLPDLLWGPSEAAGQVGAVRRASVRRERTRGVIEALSRRQRTVTPEPFRDLLLDIARSARGETR